MTTTLIRGGTVVDAEHSYRADVLIVGETIAAIGEGLEAPTGATIIDADGGEKTGTVKNRRETEKTGTVKNRKFPTEIRALFRCS